MNFISNVKINERGRIRVKDVIRLAMDAIMTNIDTVHDVDTESNDGHEFFMDVCDTKQVSSFMRVFYEHLLQYGEPVLMLTIFIMSILRGLRIIVNERQHGRRVILPYIACGNGIVQPGIFLTKEGSLIGIENYIGYDFAFGMLFIDPMQMILLAGILESYNGPTIVSITHDV